jgi:asparagine synthase (glutamine-hydrolysing)
MRLICGFFQLDGSVASESLLRKMISQLDVPRLRPSICVWREGPVALAVLDFSERGGAAASLPENASTVLAADVRLDEQATLARSIATTTRISDDALLLEVLARTGPLGLDKVYGDFAFATWNKTSQLLTCGRDVFGIRPLSYAHQAGKRFAFASFGRVLHESGVVPKTVDEDALARRLAHAARADDSLIAGIKRLPAAHYMQVSRDGISIKPYWQLDRAAIGTRDCSPEDAARELRRLVADAVQCRLKSAAEIGAHLSGGLDSSAIAVLASRQLGEQGRALHAYSFLDRQRNDVTFEDETAFVQSVLDQEGSIDWTPIRPPAGLTDMGTHVDVEKMLPEDDEFPENQVCARAEQQGVDLILSGWGGDEAATFNGRGVLAEMFRRGRWRTVAAQMSALSRERGHSMTRILYGEILAYLLPATMIDLARRIAGGAARVDSEIARSLSAQWRKRLAASNRAPLSMAPDGRENRWRLMNNWHIASRAEEWAHIGARNGLAFAFPLLDRRVVEYALSLPSTHFLRDGFRRRPFRDAMVGVLPERVRLRHQKYAPFPSTLLSLAERKAEFLQMIAALEKKSRVRGLLDLAHLRKKVEAFPAPEVVRDKLSKNELPRDAASMVAVVNALSAAAYLEQHGTGGTSEGTDAPR